MKRKKPVTEDAPGVVPVDEALLHDVIQTVWSYYATGRRDMPWRQTDDPYAIMVSELMLQQTQVERVIPKYHEFLAAFPTVQALAEAPLAAVLALWSGLGYNRRARYLHLAAQRVMHDFNGVMPRTVDELVTLPGVGRNTAGAIAAYAYDAPSVFIETNVRSVFIHHCFPVAEDPTTDDAVSDAQLLPYVCAAVLHAESPREWYWALMDYGTHLKATIGNAAKRSKHYVKQSRFHGSRRQIRGQVLRLLIASPLQEKELLVQLADDRAPGVLKELLDEGMIRRQSDDWLSLPH